MPTDKKITYISIHPATLKILLVLAPKTRDQFKSPRKLAIQIMSQKEWPYSDEQLQKLNQGMVERCGYSLLHLVVILHALPLLQKSLELFDAKQLDKHDKVAFDYAHAWGSGEQLNLLRLYPCKPASKLIYSSSKANRKLDTEAESLRFYAKCKDIIKNNAPTLNQEDTVLCLGAGSCNDLPLVWFLDRGCRVVLIDINASDCRIGIKKNVPQRYLAQIEILELDITGIITNLLRELDYYYKLYMPNKFTSFRAAINKVIPEYAVASLDAAEKVVDRLAEYNPKYLISSLILSQLLNPILVLFGNEAKLNACLELDSRETINGIMVAHWFLLQQIQAHPKLTNSPPYIYSMFTEKDTKGTLVPLDIICRTFKLSKYEFKSLQWNRRIPDMIFTVRYACFKTVNTEKEADTPEVNDTIKPNV